MLKKLTAAVSTALISTSVFALPPTAINTNTIEIFMSGASAQDKAIEGLFSNLCVAGSLDVYKDIRTDGKRGKNHSAYFCTIDRTQLSAAADQQLTDSGVTGNPDVLLHKRSAGGSAQGVNPVLDEQAIAAMVIDNTAVVAAGNCTQIAATTDWNCTIDQAGDTIDVVSDAGVSDVNPEMFIKENTPAGSSPVDAAKVASNFEVRGAAALVFGIPVTTTLRDALQVAQFGEASNCVTDKYDPALNNRTAAAESEACMPTLSKQQVASIMSGQIRAWNSLKFGGQGLVDIVSGSANATINDLVPTFSDNTTVFDPVHICRRVNGSGTQAQMSAKFMHYPCTSGADAPASVSDELNGPVIVLNSGSGNVTDCLNSYNNGTSVGGQNSFGDIVWAMGVQSTEKNADLGDDFRFIKIDGVAPTLENAVKGTYFDVVEQTFQWRKGAGNQPLTGAKLAIVSDIAANASSPVELATNTGLNPAFNHTWGQAGYLALSTNGFTPTIPFDVANPVTPYTHVRGPVLDNCVVPVVNQALQNNEVQ